jgi:threonine synthase
MERGLVGDGDRVVVLATGSGLKDIATAMKSTGQPMLVEPDLADVRRALAAS